MTPEMFEESTLGVALACLAFAGVVALLVLAEWRASRTWREQRQRALMGDALIDRIGELPEPAQVRRTRQAWQEQR